MNEETEKIIETVREHVHLYDPRHPDYKDVMKKAETWKEIAEKLDQTSEIVKLKWKNLRDSYVKYAKCLKGGATGSNKKFLNWPWAGHLEFLQETLSLRPSVSYVPLPSETFDTASADYDEEDSCPSQMPPPRKKVEKRPLDVGDVDMVISYLEKRKKESHLDRIDYLFLSYADTFKKLSPKSQAILKMEMAQIFGQAELQDLESQNPPQSSPLSSTSSPWPDCIVKIE